MNVFTQLWCRGCISPKILFFFEFLQFDISYQVNTWHECKSDKWNQMDTERTFAETNKILTKNYFLFPITMLLGWIHPHQRFVISINRGMEVDQPNWIKVSKKRKGDLFGVLKCKGCMPTPPSISKGAQSTSTSQMVEILCPLSAKWWGALPGMEIGGGECTI